jgi:hypothetical protein
MSDYNEEEYGSNWEFLEKLLNSLEKTKAPPLPKDLEDDIKRRIAYGKMKEEVGKFPQKDINSPEFQEYLKSLII